MVDFSLPVTPGTGTDYVGFDTIDATGTATTVAVQWVKLFSGTGTDRLLINNAGAALVQHVSTATIPVSIGSLPTTATLAVAVQNTATVQVSSLIPGTATNSLGKLEDGGHLSGDTGIMILGVRNDTGGSLAGSDLDYTPIRVTSGGNVVTQTRGFFSHDATSDTNPLLIGAYADTPEDSAVSDEVSGDGDLTHVKASRDGTIYTHPHPPRIWRAFYDGIAATTDATVKAAATATGLKHYVGTIFASVNVGATMFLHVGTGTASTFWRHFFATTGDGACLQFNPPIPVTATQPIMLTTAATTYSVTLTGHTSR